MTMMRDWRIVLMIVVALALMSAHTALAVATSVLADLQVRPLGSERYLVLLRATTPQAFDVIPGTGDARVTVRLYHTRLGSLSAHQGASPSLVQIRISR